MAQFSEYSKIKVKSFRLLNTEVQIVIGVWVENVIKRVDKFTLAQKWTGFNEDPPCQLLHMELGILPDSI